MILTSSHGGSSSGQDIFRSARLPYALLAVAIVKVVGMAVTRSGATAAR
jgi:hypothetical protein